MKNRLMIALIYLTLSALSLNVDANDNNSPSISDLTFLTVDNYPYKRLVEKSDRVEISYKRVSSSQMSCSVLVKYGEDEIQSDQVLVGMQHFTDDALKACLDRELAKDILGNI